MELLQRKNLSDKDLSKLPYFFSEGLESFIRNITKGSYLLFYSRETDVLMPAFTSSVNSFRLMKIIYPPVTLTGERLSASKEKSFLEESIEIIKKNELCIRIIQSHSHAVFNAVPDNSKFCAFGTYILNLENTTEDTLFANLHAKRRNTIRNAEKNNVIVKWDNNLEDFYKLYKTTMKRSGMFCDTYTHFKEFFNYLGNDSILCGVSYYEDKPQAAVFIPYSGYGGYYMYGATTDTIEQPGAMDYLQWELIKKLKRNGAKKYDFVGARLSNVTGTKLEGIQNFKKRFGGELMQGYLWKKDIDVFQCRVFDNLLGLKQVLKGKGRLKDIIDEESEKVLTHA